MIRKEGSVKGYSNLSSASLCLYGIRKLAMRKAPAMPGHISRAETGVNMLKNGKSKKGVVFTFLQRLGQSMLVPVAILPAVGLLYGLGMALTSSSLTGIAPWLTEGIWPQIAAIFSAIGSTVFGNLSILFAVGIAIGLADKHEGTAGLAAVAGYLIMNATIMVVLKLDAETVASNSALYQSSMGLYTLRTGVFGGIAVGLMSAWAYNKFHTIKVPEYMAFFGAKRFVPIMVSILSLVLGCVLCIIWPPIGNLLNMFADFAVNQNTEVGLFFYGIIVKALNPIGLHSAFYTPFQFQFGTYTSLSGEVFSGDKAMFFAQMADGARDVTAGLFNMGNFAIDTFGMIGIGLAIYKNALPERKKATAGILISACFTSFVCGITEPLLFSYLFVAPLCFAAYCILNGICYTLCYMLGIRIVATFAGGIIDYLIIGVLGNAPKWYLILPVGIVFGVLFYVIDDFLIRKFNYKTIGREDIVEGEFDEMPVPENLDERAYAIIAALGGKENIADITCCATRLRVHVKDAGIVKKEDFRKYGSKGVVDKGENLQIIIGTSVQNLLAEIEQIIG